MVLYGLSSSNFATLDAKDGNRSGVTRIAPLTTAELSTLIQFLEPGLFSACTRLHTALVVVNRSVHRSHSLSGVCSAQALLLRAFQLASRLCERRRAVSAAR